MNTFPSKNITLNHVNYITDPKHFQFIQHPNFNNLKIIPQLAQFERITGLIQDITEILPNSPSLLIFEPNDSGFISFESSTFYHSIHYLHSSPSQLFYIQENMKNIQHSQNIHFHTPQSSPHLIFTLSLSPFSQSILSFISSNDKPIIISPHHSHNIDILKSTYSHIYPLSRSNLFIHIPSHLHSSFLQQFHYYIHNSIFNYDNLIHYTMIVKNAGDTFEQVLTENLPFIDRWTILDTGSTDNTMEIIKKVLKNKKGTLYQEPFINFRESRNRCLELASNNCKFKIMLDDTYIIKGQLRDFLHEVRGDQFSNSFSMIIHSDDSQYYSNRIIKSKDNLKYISKIHEIIQDKNNINVTIPENITHIFDLRSDFMEKRTNDRKQLDLKLLFEMVEEEPQQPRHLYYIAQTYNCIGNLEKAAEYYKKRLEFPIEGFIQEKIDACFELARTYNFHLNKPWEECKKYYELAYSLDKTRPESLYFLGIHHYLKDDIVNAFPYFKRAFELGFPVHTQFSLKPTLCFHFLPKFLTNMCYQMNDSKLGETSSLLYLQHNKPTDDMYDVIQSWYGIFHYLNKLPPLNPSPINHNKPLLVYVADGGYTEWTGSDILKKGIGGSETYIIEMARWIQKHSHFQVIVFCKCPQPEIFENVQYLHLDHYPAFINDNVIHTCIISRFSQYVPMSYRGYIQNIHFVLHDISPIGSVIPIDPKLKHIFCLTQWHTDHFSNSFSACKHLAKPFHYGIDHSKFLNSQNIQKIPYRFIYSSFANRGLAIILKMWKDILYHFPKATLHIYCDIYHSWVVQNYPQDAKYIQNIIESKVFQSSITYHGWVDKQTLANAWLQADIWFYPCTFAETFCLTALEAAASKTLVITNDLAALQNTVGNRGIVIQGDSTTDEWQKKTLQIMVSSLQNNSLKQHLIQQNYEWALSHSWENRAKEFIQLYLSIPSVFTSPSIYHTPDIPYIPLLDNSKDIPVINIEKPFETSYTIPNFSENIVFYKHFNWVNDIPKNSFQNISQLLSTHLSSHSKPKILDIYSYTGISIFHLLKLLPNSIGFAIDSWDDLHIETIFQKNKTITNLSQRTQFFKSKPSHTLMQWIQQNQLFHLIHIKTHTNSSLLFHELSLAWYLLDKKSILIIDNLQLSTLSSQDASVNPSFPIQSFLESFPNKYTILLQSKEYTIIQKL